MGEPANRAGDRGVGLSVAASAASAVYGFGRSGADRRRGGRLAAVFARRGRPGFAAPAHLGSRHGAVAGHRGWLRHRGRDRLVRAFCPRHAWRHRGRGDRHPRRAERAPLEDRSRSLLAGPYAPGGSGAAGERRAHAPLHPAHRFSCHPPPARSEEILRTVSCRHRPASRRAARPFGCRYPQSLGGYERKTN